MTVKNRMVELNYSKFSFDFIRREKIVEEIGKLSSKKAFQNTDIHVKMINFIFFTSQF